MNFWWDVLPPLVAAVLIWWGATGTIIYLCGRKAWRPWVFAAITLVQPLAWWRFWVEKNSQDVGGVFASFCWAIVIWSWIETSYYSGFVVGRRVPEIEPDAPTGLRFRRAIAANLYHELCILGLSLLVVGLGWGGRNETGLWAFMILHWTHQSAKINIFLGVNNLTTEYLPENLKYMAQYFTQKPLNTFFPFSATITTALATGLFLSSLSATTVGEAVGQILLFVMMAAAVLEHWWLVTPIPTRIWEWALKSRRDQGSGVRDQELETRSQELEVRGQRSEGLADSLQPGIKSKLRTQNLELKTPLPAVALICGYLGSGKTTLIRNLLPQLSGRVAVIVNDFGTVGVDAELIRAQGGAGAVLELPGGCVCCTLQKNLTGQIIRLLEEYRPDRILIEPSGVAGIEEMVRSLASPRLAGRLGPVEIISVVDATRLLTPGGLQKFTLTQIKAAAAIVLSKTDLITPGEIASLLGLIANLNGAARLFPVIEGQLSATQLLGLATPPVEPAQTSEHQAEENEDNHEPTSPHIHNEENGLISFARQYEAVFEPAALQQLFERLAEGYFGPVERAKGLFPVPGGGRQAWDVAGGRVFRRLLSNEPVVEPTARFMVVAHDLAAEDLNNSLQDCIIERVNY